MSPQLWEGLSRPKNPHAKPVRMADLRRLQGQPLALEPQTKDNSNNISARQAQTQRLEFDASVDGMIERVQQDASVAECLVAGGATYRNLPCALQADVRAYHGILDRQQKRLLAALLRSILDQYWHNTEEILGYLGDVAAVQLSP